MTALKSFFRLEAAGGILIMVAALAALITANSPLAVHYDALLDLQLQVRLGEQGIGKPLLLWINDGLMAIFFLLVGLELKREVLAGHLSSLSQVSLPAFAAVGGMLVPAAFYAALNWQDPVAMTGWAIPTATDIAFALGILMLLGDRVPTVLKTFLLSVAIFDDLGAIIIIAVFYTSGLSLSSLLVAAVFVAGLALLNRAGVSRPAAYFLLAVPLWVAVLKSGVHATLAGVVMALFIPFEVRRSGTVDDVPVTPLRDLEHALHPWVAYAVLPLFAFANAGVSLLDVTVDNLLHPVPLGICAGLVLGKPVGVLGMCWLAQRAGLAKLPEAVDWPQLAGVSLLCGVGFTMSLFIASLAFEQGGSAYLGLDRLGILMASFVAGSLGYLLLKHRLSRLA